MRNVGPEQRTGRNGAEKQDPLSVHWGFNELTCSGGGARDRVLMLLLPP